MRQCSTVGTYSMYCVPRNRQNGSPRSPRDARAGRRLRRGTAGVFVAAGSPQRALATPREVDRRFGYLHRASSEVGGSGAIRGMVSGGAKERLM